ncbi:MAG: glycosyl hydrolase family 28 protein [Paludibacteraceae bacterium]|nr:glycosyl hydrolase family 28 protein [Paludibacteraceae bacterium]
MKKLILLSTVLFLTSGLTAGNVYNIKSFGAKGNGKTINTKAINAAIDSCFNAGGGTVMVPKGVFVTGSVVLKSNVHLYLEEGAVIKGTTKLDEYVQYIPTKDMTKYGMAYFPNWTRGLIVATAAKNISISGLGKIDGSHVEDPNGEEGKRGPHGIVFGECSNFEISGITIDKASNYAFVGYESENATFCNLTITEGWDGIHIRGGKNINIHNCKMYTGDDAIAGGFWDGVRVSDCYLNTACNGVRVIFPACNLEIGNCVFQGPGLYPQRSTFDGQRRNMLAAIIVQPGGWDYSPGPSDNIYIHDIKIDQMNAAVNFFLNRNNSSENVVVERVEATNIVLAGLSAESWNGGRFKSVRFSDIKVQFKGSNDVNLKNKRLTETSIESRSMPYWGFYGKNIDKLELSNITLTYTGEEIRPAFGFDNVAEIVIDNVKSQDVQGVSKVVCVQSGKVSGL